MNAKPTAYPILGHKHSTAMPGIEPKSLKIHSRENHFTPVIAKTRPKPRKNIINIKETSMNEIEEGTRTLNALYDTLISGNHLPNSETSFFNS